MKQYDQENCYRSKSRNIWSESSVPAPEPDSSPDGKIRPVAGELSDV